MYKRQVKKSRGGNDAIGEVGKVPTGDSRHLDGDVLIEWNVSENRPLISGCAMKVVEGIARNPSLLDEVCLLYTSRCV